MLVGWLALLCVPALASTQPIDSGGTDLVTLRRLLLQSEGSIDLARAKLTIDHLVDPAVNVQATLHELDQWTDRIRSRFPSGASNKTKINLLISTLYQPGPWNDYQPFSYDFADPFGKNLHNSLLSVYLVRRKGQCVVMPIAVVLLGQKLGLPVTLTTAPYHLIVKYGDEEQGAWTNLDATSGLFHPDSGYEAAMNISPKAIENQVFLRPYTQREAVALFATAVLVPHYLEQRRPLQAIKAIDVILEANPKDVNAMTLKANAYGMLVNDRFRSKYPLASQIPPGEQPEFLEYNREIGKWRSKAESLGWREWSKADWDRYLKLFEEQKVASQRGGK